MKLKLAQYIADFLVEQDVRQNFTVTGGGAMHLNDAFGHKQGMHCIYNHNEQASAIAAEAYARVAGKPALCCVTSGPGGTNAITGVMGGWLDSVPMLILSGQVKRETTVWSVPELHLRQLGDQEFDIVNSVRNMTKYCAMVTEPNDIAYHLEKALYLCTAGRPGPVWLDIPLDVQGAQIETDALRHFDSAAVAQVENPVYHTAFTPQILEHLTAAKRPVLFVGEGVFRGKAQETLLQLVQKLQIPVVTAWNAHDLVPDENPYYCGRPGSLGTRGGNFVVQNSDCLLVLGCRLNIRQISYNWKSFAKNAYKIVVDIDAKELQKPTLHIDFPICADVKDVIDDLLKQSYAPAAGHAEWVAWSRRINEKYPVVLPEYAATDKPLNPYVFCKSLSHCCKEGEIIITGNGSACVMMFQTAQIKKGQRLFTNSGCAAMGYGLPAALGGCVANENRRVICVDGDGSFMMNLQEMQTISTNRLPVKIFLLNNNGYHSIIQTQKNLFQPPLIGVGPESHDLGFPNFEKLADAFSIQYQKIDSQGGLNEKIEAAINCDGPVLCEVVVDSAQNFAPRLSSRAQADGTMVSPEIDDMFPFLSREEYAANQL